VYGIYEGAEDECGSVLLGQPSAQLEANCAFVVLVIVWTGVLTSVVFGTLKFCDQLRVDTDTEDEGMDSSEHGAPMKSANSQEY